MGKGTYTGLIDDSSDLSYDPAKIAIRSNLKKTVEALDAEAEQTSDEGSGSTDGQLPDSD